MTIASSTTVAHPPWRLPGDTLILGNDEVHVWRAALNCDPSQIDNFLHSLADNEQVRAERFYFAIDRERFIVAHGVLREILGRYLNRAAQSVSFRYGSHGKPALAEESDGNAIHFNMSHSRGVALYAVTRGREIGVDLEFIREDLEVEQIAERFFSRTRDRDATRASGQPPEIRVLSLLDAQGSVHQGERPGTLPALGSVRRVADSRRTCSPAENASGSRRSAPLVSTGFER